MRQTGSVKAPPIAKCLANIECKLVDIVEKHAIVILEGVKAWIDSKRKKRRTIHAMETARLSWMAGPSISRKNGEVERLALTEPTLVLESDKPCSGITH